MFGRLELPLKNPYGLEKLGADDGYFKQIALTDLSTFIEILVGPIVYSEWSLQLNKTESAVEVGVREAMLLIAVQDVAYVPATRIALMSVHTDDEVIDLLCELVQQRFAELLAEREPAPDAEDVESLGPDLLSDLKDRIGEVFDRKGEGYRVP